MPNQITHKEFLEMIQTQGHKDNFDATFQCPACKTLQSGNDLIKVSGLSRDEVRKYIGFSCIGRLNNKASGCDWTLGGLLQIHELEVVTEDGQTHPVFVPMTPEEQLEDIKQAAKEKE